MIQIAASADGNIAGPLLVMISSLMSRIPHDQPITLNIIDLGLPRYVFERLIKITKTRPRMKVLRNAICPSILDNLPTTAHLPLAAYARLLLPTLLPDVTKCLYLDCDIIVQEDVTAIWEVDVANAVAAVQDYHSPTLDMSNPQLTAVIGIDGSLPGFNSGVMLMKLDQWRDEHVGDRCLELARKYPKLLTLADQDVLNAFFANAWTKLDETWNVQVFSLLRADNQGASGVVGDLVLNAALLMKTAKIFHYVGAVKPWDHGLWDVAGGKYRKAVLESNLLSPGEKAKWFAGWSYRTFKSRMTNISRRLRGQ